MPLSSNSCSPWSTQQPNRSAVKLPNPSEPATYPSSLSVPVAAVMVASR